MANTSNLTKKWDDLGKSMTDLVKVIYKGFTGEDFNEMNIFNGEAFAELEPEEIEVTMKSITLGMQIMAFGREHCKSLARIESKLDELLGRKEDSEISIEEE